MFMLRTLFDEATLACLLLLIGYVLREVIPIFRKLYLPSSVVAGLVGLLIGLRF